jgi:hypothetical protein
MKSQIYSICHEGTKSLSFTKIYKSAKYTLCILCALVPWCLGGIFKLFGVDSTLPYYIILTRN